MAYTWTAGETVTAQKLNLASNGTFAAGSAAAPSINFTGGTTTGFYLGTTAIGFSVGGVSIATLSYVGTNTSWNLDAPAATNSASVTYASSGTVKWNLGRGVSDGSNDFVLYNNGSSTVAARWASATNLLTLAGDLIVGTLCARCSANVAVSASTSLTDLTGCSITLATGGVYAIRAAILMSATTTGGFHTVLDGTAVTANMRVQNVITLGPAGALGTLSSSTLTGLVAGNTIPSTGTNNTGLSIFEGTVEITTGGTIKVTVAQDNAAGVTTFYKNSYIWAQRIS